MRCFVYAKLLRLESFCGNMERTSRFFFVFSQLNLNATAKASFHTINKAKKIIFRFDISIIYKLDIGSKDTVFYSSTKVN